MNLSSLIDDDATIDDASTHPQETSSVFFLPLGLSNIQRDLVEVLLTLHRPSLVRQLRGLQVPRSGLSESELESLLERHLANIANHPYLLVEHYMPKRLLLMESHERLMAASDKFTKFDKLLGAIGDLPVDVLVVGHNIKELDLIEAFILGRSLSYTRYSGTPLHGAETQTASASGDPMPSENKGNGGNSKEDDYAPKKKPQPVPQQVRLHLITSQQLRSTAFTAVRPHFIVSFDAHLDEHDVNVQYVRFNPSYTAPMIKLLVVQSHLHGVITSPDLMPDIAKLRRESILSSLVNRDHDHTHDYDKQCGMLFQNVRKFFEDPLRNRWPVPRLPEFKRYPLEQVLSAVEREITPVSYGPGAKRVKREHIVVPETMDVMEYKSLLAKLTIERIGLIQRAIEDNREKLKPLRLRSTIKHAADDNLKLNICAVFKESLTLKEQATAAEKRFERLESEYEKFHEKETELEKKKEVLELISKGEKSLDDDELDAEIKTLQDAFEVLEAETKETITKTDALRQEYQQTTSTAAEKANSVKEAATQDSQLLSKLNGGGLKHRQLAHKETMINARGDIDRMKSELKFLEFYHDKLASTVKKRGATLSVGRNGRVHRSTTPYM